MTNGEVFNPWRIFVGAFLPNAVLRSTVLTPTSKLVYARLAQYAGRDGECWPSQEELATECGITRRSCIRCIAQLAQEGYIAPESYGHRMKYRFLWHESFGAVGGQNVTPAVTNCHPPIVHGTSTSTTPSEENHRRESKPEVPKQRAVTGTKRGAKPGGGYVRKTAMADDW